MDGGYSMDGGYGGFDGGYGGGGGGYGGGGGGDGYGGGGGGGGYGGGGDAYGGGGGGGGYGGGGDAYGGGGGGGGGGGYGASQGGGASQGSPSRKLDSVTITPVTVKQLKGATADHPDNSFHIDGHPINKVRLVGCIAEITANNTFVQLTLDDCTGTVSVKDWAMDPHKAALLREGVYIDVVGTWKKVKDQGFCVVSQACTLVRDFNQVTHHYLDALYVHLYNTKGPLKTDAARTNTASAAAGGYGAVGMGDQAGAGGFSAMSSAMGGARAGAGGMSNAQSAVLDMFKKGSHVDSGTDVRDVVKAMTGLGYKEDEVRRAVTDLATDGHLYNTVDDNHYQFTARGGDWD